jgi:hypothetical protein
VLLETVAAQKALALKLGERPEIARYDEADEPHGSTLAYHLAHLEESFHRFNERHLPTLISQANTSGDVLGSLHEIGEELRHVIYHIATPAYFGYLGASDQRPATSD